jgi:predicted DNA-binding ArsR family transcriptional regulator
MVSCGFNNENLINMKEDLIRKFVEKLDYSYNYKTVNEKQNIINDLCEIAGIEQLTIPAVVRRSEQLVCDEKPFDQQHGSY